MKWTRNEIIPAVVFGIGLGTLALWGRLGSETNANESTLRREAEIAYQVLSMDPATEPIAEEVTKSLESDADEEAALTGLFVILGAGSVGLTIYGFTKTRDAARLAGRSEGKTLAVNALQPFTEPQRHLVELMSQVEIVRQEVEYATREFGAVNGQYFSERLSEIVAQPFSATTHPEGDTL